VIILNGAATELESGKTVADVLELLGLALEAPGIAVAVNGEVIARREWETFALPIQARVEVLNAMQGG
jgi:thiamine biosynthesis protein ThiS